MGADGGGNSSFWKTFWPLILSGFVLAFVAAAVKLEIDFYQFRQETRGEIKRLECALYRESVARFSDNCAGTSREDEPTGTLSCVGYNNREVKFHPPVSGKACEK